MDRYIDRIRNRKLGALTSSEKYRVLQSQARHGHPAPACQDWMLGRGEERLSRSLDGKAEARSLSTPRSGDDCRGRLSPQVGKGPKGVTSSDLLDWFRGSILEEDWRACRVAKPITSRGRNAEYL